MKILGDFKTSVEKALSEIDPKWRDYRGLIVCGSHTPHNPDEIIEDIAVARERNDPFLGICYGHQLAAVEYARNVLGMYAHSEEFPPRQRDPIGMMRRNDVPPEPVFVVKKLPALKVGQYDGETYWNNYEVTEELLKMWHKPENFITCQFHPEYQSSKDKPHPLLLKFLYHAKNAPLEV